MGSVTVTALYAGILAIILVVLSIRVVVVARVKAHIPLGDGGRSDLLPAIRAQGNFIEYVPLALVLMGLLELDGASAGLLHGLGIALVAARVMHPFGMRADRGPNVPRIAGTVITWVVLLIAAVTAIARFLAGSAPAA